MLLLGLLLTDDVVSIRVCCNQSKRVSLENFAFNEAKAETLREIAGDRFLLLWGTSTRRETRVTSYPEAYPLLILRVRAPRVSVPTA